MIPKIRLSAEEEAGLEAYMQQIFVVMCVAALASFATGCEKPEVVRARQETQRAEHFNSEVNKIIDDIQYIKDPRTGLCFAYYWGGSGNGGPALATVPCDQVAGMLISTNR